LKLVDSNIIIRFITKDDPKKAEICRRLIEREMDSENLLLSDMAVAEIIWVLESVYKLKKDEIKEKIEAILNSKGLNFQNKNLLSEAIIIYSTYNIDFIDAYQSVLMQQNDIDTVYSYDKDYDKLKNINRIEP
jgi:predicted nucleic-acid-binding protein